MLELLIWIILLGLFAWAVLRYAKGIAATLLPLALAMALGFGLVVMKDLWGTCMPESFELRPGEATLLKHHWLEGEAIWLWVDWYDDVGPVCYSYPWSEEMADDLVETTEEQGQQGEGAGEIIVEFNGGNPVDEDAAEGAGFLDGFFPYFYNDETPDSSANMYLNPPEAPPLKPGPPQPTHLNRGGVFPYDTPRGPFTQ